LPDSLVAQEYDVPVLSTRLGRANQTGRLGCTQIRGLGDIRWNI
jgi:hypothetical protein